MKTENMAAIGQGQTHAKIQPVNIPVIEWNAIRVVTTETLATGYGATASNIRANLSNHRSRFIEGVHVITLTGDEVQILCANNIDAQISNKARSLTLYTEKGAARMSKIVDTDEAWSFFEKMEDSYFSSRQNTALLKNIPDFTDPASVARAWADEYEAKNKAVAITHQQAEYITQLESLFTEGLSPVQFCKRLNGVNTSKVSAHLQSVGWVYDDNPNGHNARWRVYSYARDRYLTEKASTVNPPESEGFTAYKPVLLRKGAVWLYRHYLKGELPMKSNWDGKFTNDKELVELQDAGTK